MFISINRLLKHWWLFKLLYTSFDVIHPFGIEESISLGHVMVSEWDTLQQIVF